MAIWPTDVSQVLEANPILEAFGNARTVRNNNSSRFGKYMTLRFDAHSKICGANIEQYLLETSRLTEPARLERSFHVLYQLCAVATADTELAEKFKLSPAADFGTLSGTECLAIPGMDDAREWADVLLAMQRLEMVEVKDAVLRIVAAVLHLTNIAFEQADSGAAFIKNPTSVEHAASMLEVPLAMVTKAVCFRTVAAGGESVATPLDANAAVASCRALAKTVYARLFEWLVEIINTTLNRRNMPEQPDPFSQASVDGRRRAPRGCCRSAGT